MFFSLANALLSFSFCCTEHVYDRRIHLGKIKNFFLIFLYEIYAVIVCMINMTHTVKMILLNFVKFCYTSNCPKVSGISEEQKVCLALRFCCLSCCVFGRGLAYAAHLQVVSRRRRILHRRTRAALRSAASDLLLRCCLRTTQTHQLMLGKLRKEIQSRIASYKMIIIYQTSVIYQTPIQELAFMVFLIKS